MTPYPRIIAHRCGGRLAPENSLAGLIAAARMGCKAVEFDVMLTADAVPILMHDETLDRTTCLSGQVADRCYAEIRAGDPAVPTLAEALAECQQLDLWVNIELKPAAGREMQTGEVVGRWLAAHWHGRGVISSFSKKSTLAARRFLRETAFAMLWERLPEDWLSDASAIGACAVHLDAQTVDADVAQRLRAAGMPWVAYTVNDREQAERLFSLGCTGIFTDQPDLWCTPKA